MKEFVTAVQRQEEETQEAPSGIQVKVDGRILTFYRPQEGQVAVLMAATGRHSRDGDKVAGIINFLASVCDDADSFYLETRLLDRRDPFDMGNVQDILEHLMGEWSGRPTKQPSGSGESPKTGGQNSTPPTLESTSSDSPTTSS